jgi:hypothetical protein
VPAVEKPTFNNSLFQIDKQPYLLDRPFSSTMRLHLCLLSLLPSILASLTVSGGVCDAFSFSDSLSQKHALSSSSWYSSASSTASSPTTTTMATTRRETIKMPTQTPMVPWTVSSILTYFKKYVLVGFRQILVARSQDIFSGGLEYSTGLF